MPQTRGGTHPQRVELGRVSPFRGLGNCWWSIYPERCRWADDSLHLWCLPEWLHTWLGLSSDVLFPLFPVLPCSSPSSVLRAQTRFCFSSLITDLPICKLGSAVFTF